MKSLEFMLLGESPKSLTDPVLHSKVFESRWRAYLRDHTHFNILTVAARPLAHHMKR